MDCHHGNANKVCFSLTKHLQMSTHDAVHFSIIALQAEY